MSDRKDVKEGNARIEAANMRMTKARVMYIDGKLEEVDYR